MMAPTHLAAGAAAGLAAAHISGGNPLLCMVLGALAGLLPDIDHPQGSIRRRLPGSNLLLFWLSHRGITHTALAWVVITTAASMVFLPRFDMGETLALAVSLGYASHLLTDMLTISGIPYYGPFQWRHVSLLPIRAGGLVENIFIMPGLFVVIVLMFWRLL